jgi:hypothetical protein
VIQEPKVLREQQQELKVIQVLKVPQEDRGLKELRVLIQVLKELQDHKVQQVLKELKDNKVLREQVLLVQQVP